MNTTFLHLLGVQPPRLIVPEQAASSPLPTLVGTVLIILSITLLAAAMVGIGVWRHDRRRLVAPPERAFLAYARRYALSSAQRDTARRLAGHLGPDVPPVTLLLSRAALRRAVAMELEHKPEPRAIKELQSLVEKIVGDLEAPPPVQPASPSTPAIPAPSKPVVRRKKSGA